jgi:hypothetical protein
LEDAAGERDLVVMAVDPTIQAYNKLVHRVHQITASGDALRRVALGTGNPVLLEQIDEVLSVLAAVEVMAAAAVDELWKRQPPQRVRNHVLYQQTTLGGTVE